MKTTLPLLILAYALPGFAEASIPEFSSLICRKFDYYQLAGDRKVLEVAISKEVTSLYRLQISNLYEVRQTDGSFRIRDRANVSAPIEDMLCTQADATIDEKVITCRKDSEGMDYLSIVRSDQTSIMSAMASRPGKIIRYSSYEINFLKANGREDTYRDFRLEDCVID